MRKNIDKKVFRLRKHRTRTEPGYIAPRERLRGGVDEGGIKKHKHDNSRITLEMVDPEWLAAHPDENRPSLIRDAIAGADLSDEEPQGEKSGEELERT